MASEKRREKKQQKFLEGKMPKRPGPHPEISDTQFRLGHPLFHGTSRDIEGAVLPNKVHGQGRANIETPPAEEGDTWRTPQRMKLDEWMRHNKAYATQDEEYAWDQFAHQTANRPGGGRGRVYRVDLQNDIQRGAFNNEWVADKFPIAERIDIKPGHQGTLPIDWRPYAKDRINRSGYGSDERINHPSPYQHFVDRVQGLNTQISEALDQDPLHPRTPSQNHEQLALPMDTPQRSNHSIQFYKQQP